MPDTDDFCSLQVTPADLATVFCPFGPLHSISLHKGFSFIWYLRHASASSAIEKINNTRVYPGMYDDRVREAGEHEKASMVKKLEKGKIYNIKKEKGRLVAVDWALGKDEFQKIEKSNAEKGAAAEKMQVDEEKDSDDEKEDSDEEEEDDDDDMPVAIDDDQDASDEDLDPEALAPPSDAEESMESDMDDDDDDGPAKKEDIGTTVFVRNIMFEATENELFTLCVASSSLSLHLVRMLILVALAVTADSKPSAQSGTPGSSWTPSPSALAAPGS